MSSQELSGGNGIEVYAQVTHIQPEGSSPASDASQDNATHLPGGSAADPVLKDAGAAPTHQVANPPAAEPDGPQVQAGGDGPLGGEPYASYSGDAPPSAPRHAITGPSSGPEGQSLDGRVPSGVLEASGTDDERPQDPKPRAAPASVDVGRRLLSFGVPAVLKPIPHRPTSPSLAPVPDTALDWMDTDGVSIRAVSCRGHMKRYEGELRQDAFALGEHGGYLWVTVADGVGSARRSHVGAALATALVASGLGGDLADHAGTLLMSGQPTRVRLGSLAAALNAEALRTGILARELSTTLLIAAIPVVAAKALGDGTVGGIDVVLWQVGDSPFARVQGAEVTPLGPVGDSEAALANSAVSALPEESLAEAWVEHFAPGETLALMTDGVSNIASVNAEYRAVLAGLWADGAPTPAGLLEVVDATVKSFDDDRTFLGVRFGPRTS